MIRRTLTIATGVVALFLVAAVSAFAWSGDVQGAPTLNEQSPVGYYIWHNDDGMHLRTHGPGSEHDFVARLHSDGIFYNVDAVRLESADKFSVTDGGHTILLHFHTYNWTDGLDYRVMGGTYVRYNVKLDGQETPTTSIYLGKDGAHPATDPFTLTR